MSAIATAIIAATVVTAGVSVYQGNKQEKAIKNAANDAQAANDKALADAQAEKDTAASRAQAQVMEKRRRIASNETIMTSSAGLSGQAKTAKKALLGG